jgi:adenosylcobinamide-GDP ribazoletransferase
MIRLLAALIFFTRLPFWRIAQVPADCFKRVVPLWPVVGWLTGGIMAAVFWLCSCVMPPLMAWTAAIIARLLVTGCLHEDGLADFCDGMGGGTTRQRVLEIMKDSHIGTYGVVGLILYFLMMIEAGSQVDARMMCGTIIAADCWSKACASNIINLLPYARKAEEAKSKTVYERMTVAEWLLSVCAGLLPAVLFLPPYFLPALAVPVVVFLVLTQLMRRRIEGYTGDCCGAMFLLCELSFYLTCAILDYVLFV